MPRYSGTLCSSSTIEDDDEEEEDEDVEEFSEPVVEEGGNVAEALESRLPIENREQEERSMVEAMNGATSNAIFFIHDSPVIPRICRRR